jgi:hypothetical protein
MPSEPRTKRAVAFLDGQSLFHAVKETWGYRFPNFDPKALSAAVCGAQGWTLAEVRFYTGVPAAERDARWHDFWARKTRALKTEGVYVFTRPRGTARRRSSLLATRCNASWSRKRRASTFASPSTS